MRARLADFTKTFDRHLDEFLRPGSDVPPQLADAMRYSVLAPGKRLRPYLVTRCCELVGGRAEDAWHGGAAIECVHAFSLIHDDLPAMDNDDLRRGQPTCHKRFGEALAILAGDALLALAFELLTKHTPDAGVAAGLVLELAQATGWTGMIGGQTADVLGETQPPELARVAYIHARKTGCLLTAACRLGGRLGGAAEATLAALGAYGRDLGRAFQIADDILDITSTPAALGKTVGKDAAAGKQTYPRCVGVEASQAAARSAAREAIAHLGAFGPEAADLRALADYAVDRSY